MTLNEVIAIYRKGQAQAADGTLSQTRTLVTKAYAKVRPMSGSERDRSHQREEFANYRFHVHYNASILESDIIVWNGADFNITFIADNGPREKYMYMDAERGGGM